MRLPALGLALLLGHAASAQANLAAQADDPAPRVVTGVVLDGAGNAPIAAATVASGAETVATDADGRFSVTLAPDDAGLRVAADGYLETTVALEPAVAGSGAALEILLFRNTFAETVQVVSAPAAAPERAAATPIAAEEVFEVAGAFDNIFRTLDTLPGVASTGDFGSRLAVRGGTPDQNLTVMDGVEIHNPYRLFGLVSAFNPETVERFELTAGGFGAAYGDRLSSLLIVDNRVGESDFSGSTAAGVTDANVVLEGGAPAGGSWLLSGRRTYYDLVAGLVTDQSLPAFADVQAQAHWTFGPGHRIALFGLTSRENADFRFDDEDDEESRDTGRLVSEAGNDLVSLRLDALLGGAATSRTVVSWYRNTDALGVDATFESSARRSNAPDDAVAEGLTSVVFDRDLSVRDLSVRQELAFPLSSAHTLDTGVELHRLASGAGLSITGDRNETAANPSSVRGGSGLPDSLDSSLGGTRGGAWLQDRYTITPRLSVEPGLRLDWSTVNGDAVLSPRFAATAALGWASRLRVAGGLYTQSPGYEKLIQSDYFFDLSPAVVTGLRHERATHLVTGFEKDLGADTLFRVEGYYKTFDDLIVGGLEAEAERRARVARYGLPGRAAGQRPGRGPDHQRAGERRGRPGLGRRRLPGPQRPGGPAGRLALLRLGPRRPRHLRPALSVRVRPPPRLQRRRPLPAGRALEHRRHRAGGHRLPLHARGRGAGGGRRRCPRTPRPGPRRDRRPGLHRRSRRPRRPAARTPAPLRPRRPAHRQPAGRPVRPLVVVHRGDQPAQPRQPRRVPDRAGPRPGRTAAAHHRAAERRVPDHPVVRRSHPVLAVNSSASTTTSMNRRRFKASEYANVSSA